MKIAPYISFQGNCEEALEFYNTIFNGDISIEQRYDAPEMNAPEEYRDKVLHASLQFGGNLILASDTFPGQNTGKSNGRVSLSVLIDKREEGKRIFDALADGGRVHHDYEKQFWGDWHGSLTDKFGIRWMVNCESE
jgi:PhnB protein